ncbi:MAG: hypothetical protein NTV28_11510 [Propionibacteriales bacterium]|nr:hypothetical protein [Propionibacteriales bacterium]
MLLVLLLLLACVPSALGLRAVSRDGYGVRPPPASRHDQEARRTWPR